MIFNFKKVLASVLSMALVFSGFGFVQNQNFANADDTTGIDEVVNTTVKNNDGKYYTLSGLQVEKPTAGGVYIHNGKKFVVR